jgi:hypothetical protein
VAALLFVLFYAAMALAGYVIELSFGAAGLVPTARTAHLADLGFSWDYTTWLNLGFLGLAAVLTWRFLLTGGPAMLRMMEQAPGGDPARHRHPD